MKLRLFKLALIAVLPLSVLALGAFVLQGGPQVTQADGPVSAAITRPPMHSNLSSSSAKYSGFAKVAASDDIVVAVWSEGSDNPSDDTDGVVKMAWSSGGDWEKDLVVEDRGGFVARKPAVAVYGTKAHIAWVGQQGTDFRVYYRSWTMGEASPLSSIEEIHDPSSGEELGDVGIAVTSDGTPHVVWVLKYEIDFQEVDRVYYARRLGADNWSSDVRISGRHTDPDSNIYSEDMPVIVARGSDVYVAWREKNLSNPGIYFRHRKSDGTWEPAGTSPVGKRLSVGTADERKFDEFPTMGADGSRVYVMWDRYIGEQCDPFGLNCVRVYSMTYRVTDTTEADWWPASVSQDLIDANGSITATSSVSTAQGALGQPPFEVPVPDDYLSGVRPSLAVVENSGVYTPYVVWHHWTNDTEGSIYYSYLDADDLSKPSWKGPEVITALGSIRPFAYPGLALTPGTGGDLPYDLHVVLHVRLGDGNDPWDVLYTNLYQNFLVYLPVTLKNK